MATAEFRLIAHHSTSQSENAEKPSRLIFVRLESHRLFVAYSALQGKNVHADSVAIVSAQQARQVGLTIQLQSVLM